MPSMYSKNHRASELDNVVMDFNELEEIRKSRKQNKRLDTDGIEEVDGDHEEDESMMDIDNHLKKQLSSAAKAKESDGSHVNEAQQQQPNEEEEQGFSLEKKSSNSQNEKERPRSI